MASFETSRPAPLKKVNEAQKSRNLCFRERESKLGRLVGLAILVKNFKTAVSRKRLELEQF